MRKNYANSHVKTVAYAASWQLGRSAVTKASRNLKGPKGAIVMLLFAALVYCLAVWPRQTLLAIGAVLFVLWLSGGQGTPTQPPRLVQHTVQQAGAPALDARMADNKERRP